MKQVKTLQSIGQYKTGATINVLADADVEKLVKAGKPVDGLSQSRAAELVEMGAVEEVADAEVEVEEKPTAKATTKTTTAKASITGADLKPYAETTE